MNALRQRIRPREEEAATSLLPSRPRTKDESTTATTFATAVIKKARDRTLLAVGICILCSKLVLKVRHAHRIDQWGQTMMGYRNQLLQSNVNYEGEGGATTKIRQRRHNQTWEELPSCVQRYLHRVAPNPAESLSSNLKSLSYQQRGEVSLWVDRWNNFTSSGLIAADGLALSGIVDINNIFDYHYSDVFVDGRGHRVGYQYGLFGGNIYSQNVEFGYRCISVLCQGYLLAGEDVDARDIDMLEGQKWLQHSVFIPSLLRPEAGIVSWKAKTDYRDGKEMPNSAVVTLLTEIEEDQEVYATATFDNEGWMTRLEYSETHTIHRPGKQQPWYQMAEWECRFSEYQEQVRGMWVPMRVERGMVPFLRFGGDEEDEDDDDGFLVDYRAETVALEYEFHDFERQIK